VQFVDFDGVRFHLSTLERKTALLLSMHIRCWDELIRYGAMDVIRREYGSLVQAQPESEYNISLIIDLETAPPEGGELIRMLGLFNLLTIMKNNGTLSSIPLHS
jgi:actin related protein 2/3 complex subunit 2